MLTDDEIYTIIDTEESQAISYVGLNSTISNNRALLMDYYNQEPFGDEIDGQSQVVTSDVYDTVEGMIPVLMETFTRRRHIAKFDSELAEYEDEAKQKTLYSNWVFSRQHNGSKILYDMFKDGLLQYTGWVKVFWNDYDEVNFKRYKGLSLEEVKNLELDENADILVQEEEEKEISGSDETYIVYNLEVNHTNKTGKVEIVNIPPDEGLINNDARDFDRPRFIAHRTAKRRSELIQMGFDKEIIDRLPADALVQTPESRARNKDVNVSGGKSNHKPNDLIYLTEAYSWLDVDEDGVTEYWQIFKAGGELLEKQKVSDHPFCVFVPIPMPHKAIGTCPAEKAADLQKINSTLERQALNNIYFTNFRRYVHNKNIDMDQLLTPQPGGTIGVEHNGPVQGDIMELTTQPIIQEIMAMKGMIDEQRYERTGSSKTDVGIDSEMLNVTATQFQGVKNAAQLRKEVIARLAAEGAVKQIFRKIIDNAIRYQDDRTQIKVLGETMEINPANWEQQIDCRIDVGIGAGDRQERIVGLNAILNIQNALKAEGSLLVDDMKRYNTLDKLIAEVGLKEISPYFNDLEQPDQVLQAENEQLKAIVEGLQQQMQNPLAEAEAVKQQSQTNQLLLKQQYDWQKFITQLTSDEKQSLLDAAIEFTKIEANTGEDVPGSRI